MEIICKNGTPTTRNPLNVYEQAQIRLEKIFGHFDNIYVSFSGGKDSGVLLQLCTDYIRKHCPLRSRSDERNITFFTHFHKPAVL